MTFPAMRRFPPLVETLVAVSIVYLALANIAGHKDVEVRAIRPLAGNNGIPHSGTRLPCAIQVVSWRGYG